MLSYRISNLTPELPHQLTRSRGWAQDSGGLGLAAWNNVSGTQSTGTPSIINMLQTSNSLGKRVHKYPQVLRLSLHIKQIKLD
jgi:hypothetical protein